MKNLLRSEQVMQLALAIAALHYQPIHIAWWLWPFLFLSPDLGMLGYLVNTRTGAVTYNLLHLKSIAGLLVIAGYACHAPAMLFTGLLLWAHSAFDRMMGYGLKYPDAFGHTHLGMIGKK